MYLLVGVSAGLLALGTLSTSVGMETGVSLGAVYPGPSTLSLSPPSTPVAVRPSHTQSGSLASGAELRAEMLYALSVHRSQDVPGQLVSPLREI